MAIPKNWRSAFGNVTAQRTHDEMGTYVEVEVTDEFGSGRLSREDAIGLAAFLNANAPRVEPLKSVLEAAESGPLRRALLPRPVSRLRSPRRR